MKSATSGMKFRHPGLARNMVTPGSRKAVVRFTVSAIFTALALSGCYVIPVGQDSSGDPYYVYSSAPVVPAQGAAGVPMVAPAGPIHQTLNVKLTPSMISPTRLACSPVR